MQAIYPVGHVESVNPYYEPIENITQVPAAINAKKKGKPKGSKGSGRLPTLSPEEYQDFMAILTGKCSKESLNVSAAKISGFSVLKEGEDILHYSYLVNGVFTRPKKFVLPSEKEAILSHFHGKTHAGRDKVYAEISATYLGITQKDVTNFIKKCDICSRRNPIKAAVRLIPIVSEKKFQRIFIDLVVFLSLTDENSGYSYGLTIIDHFTKFAWCFPLKTKTAAEVKKKIEILFDTMSIWPRFLHSDNGTEFAGELDEFLESRNIVHLRGRVYHPQTQGVIEKWNDTFKGPLFKLLEERKLGGRWIDTYAEVVFNYNNSVHSVHQMTSYRALYGENRRDFGNFVLETTDTELDIVEPKPQDLQDSVEQMNTVNEANKKGILNSAAKISQRLNKTERTYNVGQKVFCKVGNQKKFDINGTITTKTFRWGSYIYSVVTKDGTPYHGLRANTIKLMSNDSEKNDESFENKILDDQLQESQQKKTQTINFVELPVNCPTCDFSLNDWMTFATHSLHCATNNEGDLTCVKTMIQNAKQILKTEFHNAEFEKKDNLIPIMLKYDMKEFLNKYLLIRDDPINEVPKKSNRIDPKTNIFSKTPANKKRKISETQSLSLNKKKKTMKPGTNLVRSESTQFKNLSNQPLGKRKPKPSRYADL